MVCSRRSGGFGLAILLCAVAIPLGAAQKPADQAAKPAQPKKSPFAKLVEPWPTPEQMKERKASSEALPLFASADPLAVTITADMKAVNKDRDPNSKQRYPATLKVGDDEPIEIQLAARGHVRRMARTCDYVPLLVQFPKKSGAKTLFAKQEALKLVVQCAGGSDFEQYILKEYLAYKIFNVITPNSFRARLVRVSYVDRTSGKPAGSRLGMFLEDDTDLARRMEGRIVQLPRLVFTDLDMDTLMPVMIFEYMIGNTDFSIYALHNVRIVQRPDKSLHVVPYDFDFAGIVNPPYAVPARGLMLKSVVDRMYRGPCRRQEQVEPYIANFVAKKDLIRALPESIPGISRETRDETRSYIDGFYSSIRSTGSIRSLFVSCAQKPTM
jgi:hypothetical protein